MIRGDYSEYFQVYEYGKMSRRKAYVFGGWQMRLFMIMPIVRELGKLGYATVLFMPRNKLIAVGTDYEVIVTAGRQLAEEVSHRVSIDKQVGVQEFIDIGVSFGTMFATEAAKEVPEFRKLVLLSPFGDFSNHVVMWKSHRYFNKIIEAQPTTREESGLMLNRLGTAQGIEKLKGRKVLVGYAKKDRIIHSSVTAEMIRLMNRNGVDVETVVARGGHIRGLITHIGIRRPYKQFLAPQKSATR